MPDHEPDAAPVAPEPAGLDAFDAYRTDALDYLAGGVSHDLANPLSAMLAFASLIANDPRLPADLRDDATLLRAEAEKTHRMVRSLLEFARSRAPARTAVDVGAVLEEILELEDYVLAGVELERALPRGLPPVDVDPSRLRHLLLVLSVEALRRLGDRPLAGRLRVAASEAGGRVDVTFAWTRADGRPGVVGGAIPSARAVAAAMDATVAADDGATAGSIVASLPRSITAARRGVADASPTRASTPQPATADSDLTVLVCDDEAPIRSLLVRLLERAGFRARSAADGIEALGILAEGGIDVVLTDHLMRGMSGMDLYDAATALRPELTRRFVLMTGDASAADLVRFADDRGLTVLEKPFDTGSVADLIRRVARA